MVILHHFTDGLISKKVTFHTVCHPLEFFYIITRIIKGTVKISRMIVIIGRSKFFNFRFPSLIADQAWLMAERKKNISEADKIVISAYTPHLKQRTSMAVMATARLLSPDWRWYALWVYPVNSTAALPKKSDSIPVRPESPITTKGIRIWSWCCGSFPKKYARLIPAITEKTRKYSRILQIVFMTFLSFY